MTRKEPWYKRSVQIKSQQNIFKAQISYHPKLRKRIKPRDSDFRLTVGRREPSQLKHVVREHLVDLEYTHRGCQQAHFHPTAKPRLLAVAHSARSQDAPKRIQKAIFEQHAYINLPHEADLDTFLLWSSIPPCYSLSCQGFMEEMEGQKTPQQDRVLK